MASLDRFQPIPAATVTLGAQATDPARPGLRVQRGGGWADADPLQLRATVRVGVREDLQLMDVGVRCA